MLIKSVLLLLLSLTCVVPSLSAETIKPTTNRPKVSNNLDMGPLRANSYRTNQFYSSHAYRYNHYYSAYGPGYYFGQYTSVGKTSVWLTVGSDDYMGGGFTTVQSIPERNLVYSVTASWEQGKTWYGNYDYTTSRIAPALHWSNGTTSTYLGAEIIRSNFDFGQSEHVGFNAGITHRFGDFVSLGLELNDFTHSYKH